MDARRSIGDENRWIKRRLILRVNKLSVDHQLFAAISVASKLKQPSIDLGRPTVFLGTPKVDGF